MPTQSQKNSQDIIKLQGELKLVHEKIDTIKNNHLVHIDEKINNIYKVLWFVAALSITSLVNLVLSLLK
jgi:hypothetical protein